MKKVILSAVAIVMVSGTLVFANTGKNEKNTCDDGSVCICTPNGKCIILKQGLNTGDSNTTCDLQGCVCTE